MMLMNNRKYYVNGMHCPSCELLIEKTLIDKSNVEKVDASLNNKVVNINYKDDNSFDINELNNIFADLGYEFSENKNSQKFQFDIESFIGAVAAFIVLIVIYKYLEMLDVFNIQTLGVLTYPPKFFLVGLVAGLSSCAALIGGLLLSLSKEWNKIYANNSGPSRYTPFIMFNAGRIASYALFGGLLGLIGSKIAISIEFTAILSIIIAFVMIILSLQMFGFSLNLNFKSKWISKYITDDKNLRGIYAPLVIGALTFFIPCGFTLLAQTQALLSQNFVDGFSILTYFALGTLPILALISFSSVKLYSNKTFSGYFNYFSALLLLFFGIWTLNTQLNVLGLPNFTDIFTSETTKNTIQNTTILDENGWQVLKLEARDLDYYPAVSKLKAGIKTRVEIMNNGSVGCAQAMYSRGLFDRVINLQPGLNTFNITPQKGSYKVTCSMGMVPPVTVIVE